MRSAAFTLMEVMAVVALLGLLAGATAWSLAGEARRQTREEIIAQIVQTDLHCRVAATRTGQSHDLVFDLDEQAIWRRGPEQSETENGSHRMKIAGDYRIDRVLTSDVAHGSSPSNGGDLFVRIDAGELAITCGPAGCTTSYALRIVHEPTGESTWLLVAGLTGQTILIQNESEIEDIFTHLATGRTDAH